MKVKNKRSTLVIIILVLLFLWSGVTAADYVSVFINHQRPLFAQGAITADDGGSGTYRGIGYSYEITGSFLPDDKDYGVSYAEFQIFGVKAKTFNISVSQ